MNALHKSAARFCVSLFILAVVACAPASARVWADSGTVQDRTSGSPAQPAQEDNAATSDTRPRRVAEARAAEVPEGKTLQVAYVLYDRSILSSTEAEPTGDASPADRKIDLSTVPASRWGAGAPSAGGGAPVQHKPSLISSAPMTAGEKFGSWFHSSFLTPGAYVGAVFRGLVKELGDDDDFKEDTVGNYFADSMTRAARSFAFSATSGFFEKAMFATILRQDPRYHRSGYTSAKQKLMYAVTRVLVTQGDRCGCHQINASFLLGGAAASGIADFWERSERTGPVHTVKRWGSHIAFTALGNVLKEFLSGQ
ncbi:MAG TPA: hypothetical protein VKM94_06620 [Blastocatellia bacterium]|nr:hypothetical protein [Blastocatellia bacterium]